MCTSIGQIIHKYGHKKEGRLFPNFKSRRGEGGPPIPTGVLCVCVHVCEWEDGNPVNIHTFSVKPLQTPNDRMAPRCIITGSLLSMVELTVLPPTKLGASCTPPHPRPFSLPKSRISP